MRQGARMRGRGAGQSRMFAGACVLVGGLLISALNGCSHTTQPRVGQPYDAVIVPGCPSTDDGALSACQKRRAAWAAIVWERGLAKSFITSGAAVYSPYVEAHHLASALVALGVPAQRIYVEPQALHTDENMYNALGIARLLGLQHLAVASDRLQAAGACGMITAWGGLCTPLPLEEGTTRDRMRQIEERLAAVRIPAVATWRPLAQVEAERAQRTGRRRGPSALRYPWMWILRLVGRVVVPDEPPTPVIRRWTEIQGLSSQSS